LASLTTFTDEALIAFDTLSERAAGLVSPSLRLGVTGLSRAGKTVFISAFVHNLIHGGRLPLFEAQKSGRIARAILEEQPDDAVPRFQYEDHIAALMKDRVWPDSTRAISELRLTIEYESASAWGRLFSSGRLSVDIVDWQEMMHYVDDAVGMCAGLSSFPLKPPYHIHNFPKFISSATGIEMDEAGLTQVYKRIRNLVRAINIRRGLTRADEKPPEDHWRKRFPELEEELLNAYYKFKGWNDQGIPTKETLHELGMVYVSEDLEKRGILGYEQG
jgi:aldehyde:ferredoxin oxidoreductase